MSDRNIPTEKEVIHFGPVWYTHKYRNRASFAACSGEEVVPTVPVPRMLTRHKPWVTCEACKQTTDYVDDE